MNTSWGSPFKLNSVFGAVTATLRDVEKSIDKAMGIPEEAPIQKTEAIPNKDESSISRISELIVVAINSIEKVEQREATPLLDKSPKTQLPLEDSVEIVS